MIEDIEDKVIKQKQWIMKREKEEEEKREQVHNRRNFLASNDLFNLAILGAEKS